jgi:hypothetical protein
MMIPGICGSGSGAAGFWTLGAAGVLLFAVAFFVATGFGGETAVVP